MSSDNDKKRKLDAVAPIADGTATCEMMAEMKAMFHEKMTQMERKLARVDELEGRCKYLEDRCGSMDRSLKALAARWEYSAPDIPASHWTEQGFDEEYAATADEFLGDIRCAVSRLKDGALDPLDIDLHGPNDTQLVHDDALLPHWQNLADAIDLYGHFTGSHCNCTFSAEGIELSREVRQILTPPLSVMRKLTRLMLFRNAFEQACEGIDFAVDMLQSSPYLLTFVWVNNPFESTEDALRLIGAIKSNPSIRHVRVEECCGDNVEGYQMLSSLISETSVFETIELDGSNIRTMGDTRLHDYLAANPPLKHLSLQNNKLDDNDATLIANALSQNTILKRLFISRNEITDVGRRALDIAVYDPRTLNSAADSNHTCRIYGCATNTPGFRIINDVEFLRMHNRGRKIYHLLSSRNKDQTNVRHLNEELDEDCLKLIPTVLERIDHYCPLASPDADVGPLSIFYEILRSGKVLSLYENHGAKRIV